MRRRQDHTMGGQKAHRGSVCSWEGEAPTELPRRENPAPAHAGASLPSPLRRSKLVQTGWLNVRSRCQPPRLKKREDWHRRSLATESRPLLDEPTDDSVLTPPPTSPNWNPNIRLRETTVTKRDWCSLGQVELRNDAESARENKGNPLGELFADKTSPILCPVRDQFIHSLNVDA